MAPLRHAAWIALAGSMLGGLGAVVACGAFGSDDPPGTTPAPDAANDSQSLADSPSGADAAPADAGSSTGDSSCSWFCENFDGVWPAPGWQDPNTYLGGIIDLTTAVSASAPRSLRSNLPADSGGIAHALFARPNFGVVKSVHCELSLRVESRGTDFAEVFALDVQTPTGVTHHVQLGDNGVKLQSEINETGDTTVNVFQQLPTGVWHRVGLSFALGQPTRMTVNGVVVGQPSLSAAGDAAAAEDLTSVTFTLGASRSAGGSTGAWVYEYDDVACELGK